jgi:hypothetical protein
LLVRAGAQIGNVQLAGLLKSGLQRQLALLAARELDRLVNSGRGKPRPLSCSTRCAWPTSRHQANWHASSMTTEDVPTRLPTMRCNLSLHVP